MNKIIFNGYKSGDKNGGPTELAKILSLSINSCNGYNQNDIVKRYLKWWKTDAFDTGPTFAMVFQKVSEGMSIEDASIKVNKTLGGATAGCGPAHRIAPISAFENIPTNELVYYARKEAQITHHHPDSGNCSAVMALLCRYLLKGHSWEESKNLVSKNKNIQSTWTKIRDANLNNGGYVIDVMHSALHFLDRRNSLEESLKFSGSANYCSVIVGIIQEIINFNKHHK